MSRFRALSRRAGRAEAADGPATPPVPCVVIVGIHDTPSAALAAFAAAYPDRPRRHAPLVVPAKASTPAERERFAERFRASQLQLVASARSERLSIVVAADAEASTEPAALNRVRNVIAAAKVPATKPTFSAANRLSSAERARLRGHPRITA